MNGHAAPAGLPAAMDQWHRFFTHALGTRLDADRFASFAPLLYAKHRLPPPVVADLLLRPSPRNQTCLDPRALQYLQALLKLRFVDVTSVLRALYKYSTSQSHARTGDADGGGGDGAEKKPALRWTSSYASEEFMFYTLSKTLAQGAAAKTARDAVELVRTVARWAGLLADAATAFASNTFDTVQSLRVKEEMEAVRSAFVVLLLGACENPVILNALGKPFAKDTRKKLSASLEAFVPTIMQSSAEAGSRLELFRNQTLASFEPVDASNKDAAEADVNGLLDLMGPENLQIPEIPVAHSRAGLYIYLNATLVGRPLMDDQALYSYLHNRYQGDLQTTAIQLILASFDVLANAVFRNEGTKNGHLLKSFVVNKVPLILRNLAASSTMYPFNAEYCITEALGQVDTNVFPTLSNMFDISTTSNSFHDSVRQDFCFSCQLHGLLQESSIETLLGEITYQSLPAEGHYVKETLVQSCLEDPERTVRLIGELDNMNGNVGAAAQAIIEIMNGLCRNKETMTLKQICDQLAGKPLSLDILLLFDQPTKVLHPLCELLDNWRMDEDQGECQPVYEEFSSVLFLLLAFVYRYNLSPADLGVRSPDSFVGALLSRGNLSKPTQEMSEQEQAHMNTWIHGLFDSDAGGLVDELMSSCPPQDFYLLIPTLFHQIVLALSLGHLSEEKTLKGGLEYLVDTFLLPALIPAVLFLANHLWSANEQDQKAIIRVLQLIVSPKSGEASSALSSVLNIVAKPLEHSLRSYQRQHPKSQDIEPLLRALRDNVPLSRRTGAADHNELESWTSTQAGGLTAAVRHTMQNLIQWSLNPTMSSTMPTNYTPRQIQAATKMLGAKHVLGIIMDEVLKHHADAGNASIVYDVATALVCAPDVTNDASLTAAAAEDDGTGTFPPRPQRRLTLRDALANEHADWKRLSKSGGDPNAAEAVVRLHRRVEAQMLQLAPPPVTTMLRPGLGELGGDALDDAIATAAAAAAASGDASAADAMALDTTGLDGVGDLGLGGADLGGLTSATNSAGGLDLTDDIFGGLGGTGDFGTDFSNWDTMDMG